MQRLLEQRKAGKNRISSVSIYSSKIKCGDCGSWYGSKTWHSTSKYRQKIWQCNHKFEEKCSTPHLTEEEIQKLFLQATNKLVKNKKGIISTHKEIAKIIFDTSVLEKEKIELEEELISDFDKNVWLSMVDYLTVYQDGKIEFTFLDGSQVELDR